MPVGWNEATFFSCFLSTKDLNKLQMICSGLHLHMSNILVQSVHSHNPTNEIFSAHIIIIYIIPLLRTILIFLLGISNGMIIILYKDQLHIIDVYNHVII